MSYEDLSQTILPDLQSQIQNRLTADKVIIDNFNQIIIENNVQIQNLQNQIRQCESEKQGLNANQSTQIAEYQRQLQELQQTLQSQNAQMQALQNQFTEQSSLIEEFLTNLRVYAQELTDFEEANSNSILTSLVQSGKAQDYYESSIYREYSKLYYQLKAQGQSREDLATSITNYFTSLKSQKVSLLTQLQNSSDPLVQSALQMLQTQIAIIDKVATIEGQKFTADETYQPPKFQ